MYIKPINNKSESQIADEWDKISELRNKLIESGQDISFSDVLVPCILRQINSCNTEYVVDCGCGTGTLTKITAKYSEKIIGIDISPASISIAKQNLTKFSNIYLYNMSINEYAIKNPSSASLCLANMVLMNIVELDKAIQSIYNMLMNGGIFVFTIVHPCYWPIYWNYFEQPWFEYNKEIVIEADFFTSLSNSSLGISTHIHRPLNMYIDILLNQGFKIIGCEEPYPTTTHNDKNYIYSYPRFLLFKCQKIET